MSYEIDVTDLALDGIEKHKRAGDKAILIKLEKLLNVLREHPKTGTGKPEKLRYDLEGFWSRRKNKKHRLIYKIDKKSSNRIGCEHLFTLWR